VNGELNAETEVLQWFQQGMRSVPKVEPVML
jgi:hypothetical protein